MQFHRNAPVRLCAQASLSGVCPMQVVLPAEVWPVMVGGGWAGQWAGRDAMVAPSRPRTHLAAILTILALLATTTVIICYFFAFRGGEGSGQQELRGNGPPPASTARPAPRLTRGGLPCTFPSGRTGRWRLRIGRRICDVQWRTGRSGLTAFPQRGGAGPGAPPPPAGTTASSHQRRSGYCSDKTHVVSRY